MLLLLPSHTDWKREIVVNKHNFEVGFWQRGSILHHLEKVSVDIIFQGYIRQIIR